MVRNVYDTSKDESFIYFPECKAKINENLIVLIFSANINWSVWREISAGKIHVYEC
jgi:hypothetical protein